MRAPLNCIRRLTFARCMYVHPQDDKDGKSEPSPAQQSGHVSTLLLVLIVLVLAFVLATLGITIVSSGLIKKIDAKLSTKHIETFASRDGLDVVTEDNYCSGTNPGQ